MKLAVVSNSFASDSGAPEVLVGRILDGDPSAGDELVARYHQAVAALIERRVPDRSDSDDAFQQTFAIALQKIRKGELREPARLSGFMCGIARTIAAEFARRPSRSRTEALSSEPETREPGPLDQVLRKETAEAVHEVLNSLSARDREVLRRFYLADESKGSICQRLGLGSMQFDQVVFHARQRYRTRFRAAVAKKGWKILR